MNGQLPHEVIMTLEDKAKLFDKIVRYHKIKVDLMKQSNTNGQAISNRFMIQVTKIMRDAERYGFL
jgi:hypothetical protein